MAATTAIWNAMEAAKPPVNAIPMSSTQNSGSGAQASTISANDFLTLLVTEMKNQDPTANTDPNEYINQLVQVNSLEQLIDINQNLSSALGSSGTGSTGSQPAAQALRESHLPGSELVSGTQAAASTYAGGGIHSALPIDAASGNLGIPNRTAAAERVAQALSGRS